MPHGVPYKHDWIWQKNRGSNFSCVKYQPTYNPVMQERAESRKGRVKYKIQYKDTNTNLYGDGFHNLMHTIRPMERYPSSVQKFNTEVGLHPTQKSAALCEYLIKTYTDEGMTVLDNCMDSGTTGVACLNLNRDFIGIELDEHYFEVAKQRIETVKAHQTSLP